MALRLFLARSLLIALCHENENNLKAIDLHNKVTGEELERFLKMQLAALVEDP